MAIRTIEGPGIGLPLRFKVKAWIFCFALVTAGCVISSWQKDWGWLARAGAVVTVVALIAASFNTNLLANFLSTQLDEAFDPSEKIYERMREKPHLFGISQALSEDQCRDLIAKERERQQGEIRRILDREMSDDLKKLELRIAIIGTMLWGFADLFNRLYPSLTCLCGNSAAGN